MILSTTRRRGPKLQPRLDREHWGQFWQNVKSSAIGSDDALCHHGTLDQTMPCAIIALATLRKPAAFAPADTKIMLQLDCKVRGTPAAAGSGGRYLRKN